MRVDWLAEVEKRKDQLLAETQALLQIPSVLDGNTTRDGAPFGTEVARALEYVLDLAEQNGMRTKNLDGYIGYGEYGEGAEMIGILCHVDVVPAGDGWSIPPFSAEMVQDRLVARGAIDDKGPTMAAFYGAKIVKELGLPLKRRVRLIFGADEESEWRCVERYFAEEEMPKYGFAPDADFPLIHAEKGMYNVIVNQDIHTALEGSIQLIRFNAGIRPNMVPDAAEAELRFTSGEDIQQVCEAFVHFCEEYGRLGKFEVDGKTCRFKMDGVSSHGSTPHRGVHAGWMLSRFLDGIDLDERGSSFISLLHDCFIDDPFGAKLGIAAMDPEMGELTINVGVVHYESDGKGDSRLVLNIRYPSNTTVEDIREKLQKRLAHYDCYILEEDTKLKPHHIAKYHPLVTTLMRIYEQHTETKADPLAIGGATYARSLNLGVAFGAQFPGREDKAHEKDEYILIEDLLKATAIYAEAIYELANME